MKQLLPLIVLSSLLSFLLGPVQGQREVSQSFVKNSDANPPQSYILDADELFPDPEVYADLSRKLSDLEQKYDYPIYFIIYSGFVGDTLQKKANSFRDLWLSEEKEGLIFACDVGSKLNVFSLPKTTNHSPEGTVTPWKLSDYQVIEALNKVLLQSISPDLTKEEQVLQIGDSLITEIGQRLEEAATPTPINYLPYLALFLLASLGILSFIWLYIARRAKDATLARAIIFPDIKVSSRLGALYGGGVVSELSYEVPEATPLIPSEEPEDEADREQPD